MGVVFRSIRTKQPTFRTQLDTDHPLVSSSGTSVIPANGGPLVLSCYNSAVDYSRPPINYVKQNINTASDTSSAVTFATSPFGVVPVFNGSSSFARVGFDAGPYTKATISFWLWWDAFNNSDSQIAIEYTGNYNSNQAFLVEPNDTSGSFGFKIHSGSSYCAALVTRPSAAAWHHYAMVMDLTLTSSQVTAVYIDGISQSITYSVNTISVGNTTFSVGGHIYFLNRGLASLFGAGRISNFNFHNKLLAENEIRSLMNNPWQILQPERRRIYATVAVATGVNYRWFLMQ